MVAQAQHSFSEDLTSTLRTVPIQARANLRLNVLIDAAAVVIDRTGYERLTTQDVASEVGCSIGTLYRYFPDRVAVLRAVVLRNITDFTATYIDAPTSAEDQSDEGWIDQVLAGMVASFRWRVGFRSLRFGDMLDLGPNDDDAGGIAAIAFSLSARMALSGGSDRQCVARVPEEVGEWIAARARLLEVSLTVFDAMVARAFSRDRNGDPQRLADAYRSARASYLPMPVED